MYLFTHLFNNCAILTGNGMLFLFEFQRAISRSVLPMMSLELLTVIAKSFLWAPLSYLMRSTKVDRTDFDKGFAG